MHHQNSSFLALQVIPTLARLVGLVIAASIPVFIFGVSRWRQPIGKVAAIAAGLVLLSFAVVLIGVLITVSSGSMG